MLGLGTWLTGTHRVSVRGIHSCELHPGGAQGPGRSYIGHTINVDVERGFRGSFEPPTPTPFPHRSTAFVCPLPCHNLCFALSPSDIDRCATGATNICGPGTCVNLPDGYRCICSPGYRLHPSQAYCTGTCFASWALSVSGVAENRAGEQSQESRQQKVQAVLCGLWVEEEHSPCRKS